MFTKLFPTLCSHSRRRRASREIVAAMESLETRQLLTAQLLINATTTTNLVNTDVTTINPGPIAPTAPPAPIVFDPANGALTLNGDDAANAATVKVDLRNVNDPTDDQIVATITRGGLTHQLAVAKSSVTQIVFLGAGGNDRFTNFTDKTSFAYGGLGDDRLSGGQGRDNLYGEAGHDFLYGGVGDDIIYGGSENDTIVGGEGSDRLNGDGGHDTISDYAFGWNDVNVIAGGDGNDLIYGQGTAGAVTIRGGAGDDTIYAFGRLVSVYGDEGHDTLTSPETAIRVEIFGGAGNDIITGSRGNDVLHGDDGNDEIYAWLGNDLVYGGSGDDRLFGSDGNDSLLGEDGDDEISGNGGHDFIYGGNGDDILLGGGGNDGVFGGDGNDGLWGDDGNDYLQGGYVNFNFDTLLVEEDISDGNIDHLYNGEGSDIFVVSDKKLPGLWLDHEVYPSSEDTVVYVGWTDVWLSHTGYFGHTYYG